MLSKRKPIPSSQKPKPIRTEKPNTIYEDDLSDEDVAIILIRGSSFLIPFILYVITIKGWITGGDSPELVISAYQLGVAHPPGYPLWTLLTWFVLQLPGNWSNALRAGLLSVLFQSVANFLLSISIEKFIDLLVKDKKDSDITQSPRALRSIFASIASIAWATNTVTWTYATQPEVFALNNLLVCLLVFVSLLWYERYLIGDGSEHTFSLWGAFLCGLGMAHQQTIVFYEIPLIIWVLIKSRKNLTRTRLLHHMGLYLLGLSPYLLLPLNQWHHPSPYSWGHVTTISGFLTHVFRTEYGTFRLYADPSEIENPESKFGINFLLYFFHTRQEYGWIGIISAILGIIYSFRTKLGSIFILCFGTYVGIFFYLSNLPVHKSLFTGVFFRFFPQADILASIFGSVGLNIFYINLPKSSLVRKPSFIFALVGLFFFGRFLFQFPTHFENSENPYVTTFGYGILEPLPFKAILLLLGDLPTNLGIFLQISEKFRPDLVLLSVNHMTYEWFNKTQAHLYGDVVFPGRVYHPYKPGGYTIAQFIDANVKNHPIYVCGGWKSGDDSYKKFKITNFGFTQKVDLPNNLEDTFDETKEEERLNSIVWPLQSFLLPPPRSMSIFHKGTWEGEVVHLYFYHYHLHAWDYLEFALTTKIPNLKKKALENSLKHYGTILEKSGMVEGSLLEEIFFHVGLGYDHYKQFFEKGSVDYDRCVDKLLENWKLYLEREGKEWENKFVVDEETKKVVVQTVAFWEKEKNKQ